MNRNVRFSKVLRISISTVSVIVFYQVLNGTSQKEDEPKKEQLLISRTETVSTVVPVHKLLMEWQRSYRRNGLGNQLFFYAALLGISRRNNFIPVMPEYNSILKLLHTTSAIVVNDSHFDNLITNAKDLPNYDIYSSICCIYLPFTERLHQFAESDIVLRGAFQSWKYFHPQLSLIKNEYAFREDIQQEAQEIINALWNQLNSRNEMNVPPKICGIHIRRGDIRKTHLRHFGHKPAPESYFNSARNYIESRHANVVYIVMSNDLPWARSVITGSHMVFVEDPRPEINLAMMTLMPLLILSVGTFSWWGAFLSNATDVVYYAGTPQAGSFYDVTFRAEDYWLPHWKGII